MSDYIKLETALALADEYVSDLDDLCALRDALESLEPADVRPVVHGSWRAVSFHEVACTKCGYVVDIMKADVDHMKFCNECGADMRSADKEEEHDKR